MKKLIIAALLLIVGTGAFAQSEFNFGARAGIAGNWIQGANIDPGDKVSPNVGFYAGAFAVWNFGSSAFLDAEVLFARKGISTTNDVTDVKWSRKLGYIQVPVLLGFKMRDDRLRLMFGPEFGWNLMNKTTGADIAAVGNSARKFNLALALQGTFLVADHLGIDVKVDYGLTKTFLANSVASVASDNGRNVSVQLGLSFMIGD